MVKRPQSRVVKKKRPGRVVKHAKMDWFTRWENLSDARRAELEELVRVAHKCRVGPFVKRALE